MTRRSTHKGDVISNSDHSAFVLPKIKALVTTEDVPRTTPSLVKKEGGDKMALWDPSNDFPQKVIEDVRKDPEIGTLLNKQAALLYSGGLVWGKITMKEGGKEIMEPLDESKMLEVSDWMLKSNINRYLIEAATDFYWFRNVFPEVVTSRDRSKIVQLCVQPAEACRWEVQDNNGIVKFCYINPNFPEGKESDKLTKKLPVLDPYYDAAGNLAARSETNLIYPLSYPSPGSTYYQMADWNSIRLSGWLAISQSIPKFKSSLLEKQLTIKYHIEISQLYWGYKYKDWDKMKEEKKVQVKEEELKRFSDMMSGVDQSGNSLVTAMHTDVVNGKEFAMWKVTPIDDKIKDGKFLEDLKDASLYKSMAIGLHPALNGNVPNSGLGGAGSNIREAYNLHMLMVKAHQDIILEPLYLVRNYNKWDPLLQFRFRNSFMNTLDKGEETSKTIT